MNVNLVADVGNSRVKWGVCARVDEAPAVVRRASLGDEYAEWQGQLTRWMDEFPLWKMGGSLVWAVAGVHPERCDRLSDWLVSRGHRVVRIDRRDQLPVQVEVDEPERVGLDRLLNAVAAKQELAANQPGILIDAGTAVTVDWLDETHVFRGGAIFPGVRLMAKALHDYTALLPEITVGPPAPALPGKSTVPAMQAGVFWAVLGGIDLIARRLRQAGSRVPYVFLTGGEAEWIIEALDENDPLPWMDDFAKMHWPEQTLHGILLTAEALPS